MRVSVGEQALAREQQHGDLGAFVRACLAAAWLEYRNLRYYPSNLALAAVQQLTTVALWYFTAVFLSGGANAAVRQYGGNYVAYVVVGVLLNQVGLAALDSPFTTISEAFWDKRLETYRLAIHGIWANVLGRLGWNVAFSALMQLVALLVLLASGAIQVHASFLIAVLVALTALLFIAANAGLGIAGASLFFLLEVKSGQDPITWAYRYLVMLFSGLYVPLSVLPGWLRGVGATLPQTYGFAALRALVLNGGGLGDPSVWRPLLGLAVTALLACAAGFLLLRGALRRAERRGGIGVVV
jgi:ABC-2 type transport system permease protein